MRPLEAHLRQPGSHGHLPFHQGCPVCRAERLAGAPPGDEVVSARMRAVLVAGLMAATGVPAAPAMAAEPDVEQEGTADEKAQGPAGDAGPGFNEGNEDTDLPIEEGIEMPPGADDGEVEPTPEREVEPVEGGPDLPAGVPGTPHAPPAPTTRPPTSDPQAPPAAEGPNGPAGTPRDRDDRSRARPRETIPLRTPGPPLSAPQDRAPAGDPTPPTPSGTQQGAPAGPVATDETRAAPTGDPPVGTLPPIPSDGRTHVVRQGECLWSIAHDQIGSDATPAQVARLVNRLWNLNRERIGTGEPDLLMVGTELRLP